MLRKLALLLLLSIVLMIAPGAGAQSDSPQELVFFLTFIPNIQFAPLYAAIEQGYFSEQGIKVTIQHGDEPDGVNLIAADQLKFGIISGEQVIQARANGRPVVYVYEWFQKYPVGVVTPVDSGIEAVGDLVGRKVGIPGRFGASYSGLVALLEANDMQESDLQLEPIGFNAPESVCLGQVEASVVYLNNEPLQIEQRAAAGDCGEITGVNVLSVADAADMVSNGVVTNEATLAADPELVRAVVAAFDRGLRSVIDNPAAAYLMSTSYVENLPLGDDLQAALEAAAAQQNEFLASNPDRTFVATSRASMIASLAEQFDDERLLQLRVLLTSIELWDAERLGYSDLSSWELTQEILIAMGFVSEPSDLAAAFTNDFLPAAP